MAKVYECWIKPPNEDWFNYSSTTEIGFQLSSLYDGINNDPTILPRHFLNNNGLDSYNFFSKGYKMQWRPKSDPNWREREQHRMSRKDRKDMYSLLPKEWNKLVPITDHFAHLSVEIDEDQPDIIAYTMSEQKGEHDIQTKIKAGKYLKKYYPKLSNEEIRHYSEAVQSLLSDLNITDDPYEAALVYQNGPDSCMKRTIDYFEYPKELTEQGICHPVAAYFAGDLKLAYLGTIEAPTARCIVWPDKKLSGRIYGAKERMTHALQRLGYTDCYYGWRGDSFASARMKLIHIETDQIVWPYTDGFGPPLMNKEDREHVYIGPEKFLDKDKRWFFTNISYGESGTSRYRDPLVIYCAISGKIIPDDLLEDPTMVGYIAKDRPAWVNRLKACNYELLEGEVFWLPKHHIAFFVDSEGNYKKTNIDKIEYRHQVQIAHRKGYNCYCHRRDAIIIQGDEYVHKTEKDKLVFYKGRYYRDLEHLYTYFPSLNPGRVMFNVPLDQIQNEIVQGYIYYHSVKTIVNAKVLGEAFRQNYYGSQS